MAKRDSFLLRADPKVLDAIRKWAADDLRSINAQIEFVLRRALREAGRLPGDTIEERDDNSGGTDEPDVT